MRSDLNLVATALLDLLSHIPPKDFANLFWQVAGYDPPAHQLIIEVAACVDERGVLNLVMLVDKAIPRSGFTNPFFARDLLLASFTGKQREQLVEAFASQARHLGGGVFQGNPDDYMAQRQKQFADQVAALLNEPGLEDLVRALRRFT